MFPTDTNSAILRPEDSLRSEKSAVPSNVLLAIENLSKTYNGKKVALSNTNLDIRRAEFVSVIGRSGAGKSTLLRCINRLVEPTSGKILFDGTDILRVRGRALRNVRRRISMVFQHYNLVHRATAIENVLQGRLGYKSSLAGALGFFNAADRELALEMLKRVDMQDYALTRADCLSGGQRQRVGIARALVQNPLLILADEPIASLDPSTSRQVMQLLRQAVDDLGISVLVSLHQVDFAIEFSDRVIGLSDGEMLFDGAPRELSPEKIAEIYGDVDN